MSDRSSAVRIFQSFDAPPGRVWEAWTEPGAIREWWGSDRHGSVDQADVDLRPGGRFEITFRDHDGSPHTCGGVYREAAPVTRLTFSWCGEDEPDEESQVTVVFSPEGDGTRMFLEHTRLARESAPGCERAWQRALAKLDRVLRGGSRRREGAKAQRSGAA